MTPTLSQENPQPSITAIGTATPIYRQSQSELFDLITTRFQLNRAEQRILKTIYRESGVDYRHSVLEDFIKKNDALTFFPNNPDDLFPSTEIRMKIYKENALTLALSAINDCFSSLTHFNKEDITHLITVSCTGMFAPGLDVELVQHLGLTQSLQRTAINFMGCYGLFNGLKVAQAICKGDKTAKVLLVSVEICTIHFQKKFNLDNLIASTIFADGAGALLIEGNPSQNRYLTFQAFYCDILAKSQEEMTWDIGNHGFDIRLSSYVPHLIEKGIAEFFNKLLKRKALTFDNIHHFAIHPGAKKILEACEHSLKISPEDNRYSYEILRNYGNMSSATIAFVLKKLWQSMQQIDHQKNIFCCAFGPGLTLESMLLNIHYA